MKRFLIYLTAILASGLYAAADVSLEYCLERARENYPVIKKYELVEKNGQLDLDEINRSWLPRIEVYAQATVQNVVPSFPGALSGVMEQMGYEMKGLGHLQYKGAVELSQNVWDGGTSKAARSVTRATTAENQAAVAVEMYGVREKVENLFFGILLLQEQMEQTRLSITLLENNLGRLDAMVENGTAMQSDADMVEAQCLTLKQKLTEAVNAADSYRKLLEIYMGESIGLQRLICPSAVIPSSDESARPELTLFESKLALNRERKEAVEATLMPRIGLFAQVYYGYPGINYFESMMRRDMSFNALAGIKVSWNIDVFYTRETKRRQLSVSDDMIRADREMFLFNSALRSEQELSAIKGLTEVMSDDRRIVKLRENVRRSAEAQLENGVIDATALLTKVTDENQARLTAAYHQIQYVQYIYQLKNTLNK
ncbi:MAG: TolC family protein [Bacteroidales bacterium]|nr:TolC family protein [Bacteroidales bacterium]